MSARKDMVIERVVWTDDQLAAELVALVGGQRDENQRMIVRLSVNLIRDIQIGMNMAKDATKG